jgi:CubicO group peptidase (beta-lactamase class C family)
MHTRTLLSLVFVFLLPWGSALAQEEAIRLQQAYQRIDEFVAQHMEESGTPGLALALTSREGLLRVATYGFADIKARKPVTPDTLFQIGSISKSFTAIALLQLREEGRFDPQAPLSRYLPWFEIQTEYESLTGHYLLTHTAGIPRDRDDISSSAYSAFALRERSTGYAPGKKFSYSNIGYQVLGTLLETLERQSYVEVIRRRIFEPLGMTASVPVISFASRPRMAVGYQQLYDDRPPHRSHPLVEAPWFEYGAGDGSIAATPAELATYLRMLLNGGAGPKGRVLPEESFDLLTQRAVEVSEDGYYGYGIRTRTQDGHTLIGHDGGMVGYASAMRGDPDAGVGVVVLVNGPARSGLAEFALKTLRAAMAAEELPRLPERKSPARVENAAGYAGTYRTADGRELRLEAEGERLLLHHTGTALTLERREKDAFYAKHPDFALFLLQFQRDDSGKVAELFHGADWYTNERYSGPREFKTPAEWKAYVGHYRTSNPWFSNFRVLLRKGKLWLALVWGEEEELVEQEPGLFQVGREETAERLRIDSVVDGKALRANFSGVDYYRSFTP